MTRTLLCLNVVALFCMLGCNIKDPAITLPPASSADMRSAQGDMPPATGDMRADDGDFGRVRDMARDMATGGTKDLDEVDQDASQDMGPVRNVTLFPACEGLETPGGPGSRVSALCVTSQADAWAQRASASGIVSSDEEVFTAKNTPGTYSYDSSILDLGAERSLYGVTWSQNTPFDLSLPLTSAKERGAERDVYDSAGLDMQGLELLQLFDQASVFKNAEGLMVLKDQSDLPGLRDMVQAEMEDVPRLEPSPLGTSLFIAKKYHYTLPITSEALQFGKDAFTLGVWAKHDDTLKENRVIFGLYDDIAAVSGYSQLWLGYAAGMVDRPGNCKDAQPGVPMMMFVSKEARRVALCGLENLNDGAWHHLVVVREGATHQLYVDGKLVAQLSLKEPTLDFAWTKTGPDARLGSFPSSIGQYDTEITLDEFALWRRALSEAEVLDWAQRAHTRLTLEVALCASPQACEEPQWIEMPLERSITPRAVRKAAVFKPSGSKKAELYAGRFFRYRVTIKRSAPTTVAPGIKGLQWEFQ